jgi:AcrR family transcriptional regulator
MSTREVVSIMPRKTDVPSRIIRAAVALFARQGYHGTSTRDIARLADVSEVTLYRYFQHKEDVFWAALSSCFEALKPRFIALQVNGKTLTPHVFVRKVLDMLVDTATYTPELIRLVADAMLELRGKAEEVCREHISPLFASMTEYFQENIERGNVRNIDPAIIATGIALTVFAQPELSKLIEGCHLSRMDSRQVLETYTQFWLGALLPPQENRALEPFPPSEAMSA